MSGNTHYIINTVSQQWECYHCGLEEPLILPMGAKEVAQKAEDFSNKHRRCKMTSQGKALKLKAKRAWEEFESSEKE